MQLGTAGVFVEFVRPLFAAGRELVEPIGGRISGESDR